jgi:hypothetical protein
VSPLAEPESSRPVRRATETDGPVRSYLSLVGVLAVLFGGLGCNSSGLNSVQTWQTSSATLVGTWVLSRAHGLDCIKCTFFNFLMFTVTLVRTTAEESERSKQTFLDVL